MSKLEDARSIGDTVILELDSFQKNFEARAFPVAGDAGAHGVIAERIVAVQAEMREAAKEPFVSLVRVRESQTRRETEYERVYLVCRHYIPFFDPATADALYCNRNVRLGKIASVEIGDEVVVPLPYGREKRAIVLARDNFVPINTGGNWDGCRNHITVGFDEFFPASLRDWLAERLVPVTEVPVRGDGLLEEIQRERAEEDRRARSNRDRKLVQRRIVVDSISLKDQPILDAFQDEFCRLPLSSRILLIGAPGTGKTTSLIKRISFKLDPEHLADYADIQLDSPIQRRWLMFTPNDLLRNYLKEAMNKEGLSASDNNVKTWESFSVGLARDTFGYLKTGDRGHFSRTRSRESLADTSSMGVSATALRFEAFLHDSFKNDFVRAIQALYDDAPRAELIGRECIEDFRKFQEFRSQCDGVRSILDRQPGMISMAQRTLLAIDAFSRANSARIDLRQRLKKKFESLAEMSVKDESDHFSRVLEVVRSSKDQIDLTDDDAEIDEPDEEEISSEHAIQHAENVEAFNLISRAIVAYAESKYRKKSIKNVRHRAVLEILGDWLTGYPELEFFGAMSFLTRNGVFRSNNPERLLRRLPQIYDRFRRQSLSESSEIFGDNARENAKERRVSEAEIDILIWSALNLAREIFKERRDLLDNESKFYILERIKELYQTQIVVDEATDFSAVQLSAMGRLSHPSADSVTFAGDLMQRVTSNGLVSWDELIPLLGEFERTDLEISYRHTPVLLSIAGKMFEHSLGEPPPFSSKFSGDEDYPLPLRFRSNDVGRTGRWIVDRILEIYRINGSKLPSIAVFVPEEKELESAFETIYEGLDEHSIEVEKCPEGKVLGTNAKVRIFSVEYIKGLEFEGVFFVGIDRMAQLSAELLDKYLYVGLTRATTFLTVTHEREFPDEIRYIEDDFSEGDWRAFV